MSPRFSILNQTRIMTPIQISAMINNSSKINFLVQNTSISVTTSMGDETKNGAEFLVTVPFDTKKQLSCTIKQFPTLVKEAVSINKVIAIESLLISNCHN